VFRILWVLLVLAITGAVVAWSIRVPVYASGPAVVLDPAGLATLEELELPGLALVVFVPPDEPGVLRVVGSELLVDWGASGERVPASIARLSGKVHSPAELRELLGLEGAAAAAVARPSAMIVARAPAPPPGLATEQLVGGVHVAEVRVGERRVLALLPWIGRFFEER
jgi:hypothetical protein